MIDVKANFGNMYKDNMNCKLGCDEVDSQEHLIECPILNDNDLTEVNGVAQYEDLFSSQVEDQLRIASIPEERFSRRKEKTK